MRKFKFNPEKLSSPEGGDDINNPWDGHVIIEVPTYKERLVLIKTISAAKDDIDKGIDMVEIAMKHVTEVKLKNIKTGSEINTIEDLSYFREGTAFINEIGKAVINGVSIDNPF